MLTCILDGLADEAEGVRDAALASGRVAVELYAQSALPLLLPAVEAGITSHNWRIRQSSVELLGDLLFKVGLQAGGAAWAGGQAREGARGEVGEQGWSAEASALLQWNLLPSFRTVNAACPPFDLSPCLACCAAQVAGTTGRIQQDLHNDDEEGISVEAHGRAIVDAMGLQK